MDFFCTLPWPRQSARITGGVTALRSHTISPMPAWFDRLLGRGAARRDDYRELVAGLPVPTAEQTEAFAVHLVGAHSWYKHLPCAPVGAAFVVFLDPNAGRELVHTCGGPEFRDRVDEREAFHYTWMPTAEYRTRFGHWHYATDHGTQFVVRRSDSDGGTQIHRHDLARVIGPDGELPVSPDLCAAGTVHLTAHVHDTFVAEWVHYYGAMLRRQREEMGDRLGGPTYRQDILDLCDRHSDDLTRFDRELAAERSRLRGELRATLERVRDLLAAR